MSKLNERLEASYYMARQNEAYQRYPKTIRARWEAQRELEAEFRKDLEDEYGITEALAAGKVTLEKATKLFDLAWEIGHSSGYREVDLHYSELVELVL